MSKSQRTKGHSFERRIAQDMIECGFKEARRQLEYNAQDANGIDLQETGRFKIQCKAMKKQPNIVSVMKEIKCLEDDIPVVVFKVDNSGTFATLRWSDTKTLISLFNYISKKVDF